MPDSTGRTARITLLLALALMAAVFAAQGAVDTLLTRDADARARQTFSESLASSQLLFQISRDVDRKRILVDGHIFTHNVAAMQAKEAELAAVSIELARAERAYANLPMGPQKTLIWHRVLGLVDAFDRSVAEAIELSRKGLRLEAYSRMTFADSQYEALHDDLSKLVRINEREASASVARIKTLQQDREKARWGIRGVGLMILALFGWWGFRRIAHYEDEIARYHRELEERNNDLDAFAGRAAHDLRNTLAPVATIGDLLRASSNDPQVLGVATRADRWSRQAMTVLDELLDFARSGRVPAPGERASLAPVMESVREELAPVVAGVGASLELDPIPAVSVRCSPGLLHVVLANLCGNAVKFVEGQNVRRVHVQASTEGGFGRIAVEDTGPGIPRAIQERIFDPFFRAEDARARGTGLGLATVRRIVSARGGRVEVESAAGQGARFLVWLPLAPAASDTPPAPGAQPADSHA